MVHIFFKRTVHRQRQKDDLDDLRWIVIFPFSEKVRGPGNFRVNGHEQFVYV